MKFVIVLAALAVAVFSLPDACARMDPLDYGISTFEYDKDATWCLQFSVNPVPGYKTFAVLRRSVSFKNRNSSLYFCASPDPSVLDTPCTLFDGSYTLFSEYAQENVYGRIDLHLEGEDVGTKVKFEINKFNGAYETEWKGACPNGGCGSSGACVNGKCTCDKGHPYCPAEELAPDNICQFRREFPLDTVYHLSSAGTATWCLKFNMTPSGGKKVYVDLRRLYRFTKSPSYLYLCVGTEESVLDNPCTEEQSSYSFNADKTLETVYARIDCDLNTFDRGNDIDAYLKMYLGDSESDWDGACPNGNCGSHGACSNETCICDQGHTNCGRKKSSSFMNHPLFALSILSLFLLLLL